MQGHDVNLAPADTIIGQLCSPKYTSYGDKSRSTSSPAMRPVLISDIHLRD
jgi:hypothetical protein